MTAASISGVRRTAPRDDDLLAVDERSREVHRSEIRTSGRAACPGDRIRDPRPVTQPEQTRAPDRADDMHVEQGRARDAPGGADPGQRCDRGGAAARADPRQPRSGDREQHHEWHEEEPHLDARQREHPSRVAGDQCRKCAGFVPNV